MKIRRSLILLLMARTVDSAPSADVTIKPIIHEVKYCLGPTSHFPQKQEPGPSDITLRLSLTLLYENHGSGPIILPLGYGSIARVVVVGEQDMRTVASRDNPFDPNALVGFSLPAPPYFAVIPGGKSELRYFGEFVYVPVRSADWQLLGKTIQLSITRDHGLPSSVIEELQRKWKSYGVFWTGIQDSERVTVSIPASPATADCRKDERF